MLVRHDKRHDELVGRAVVVRLLDARDCVFIGAALGLALDHRVESLFLPFPAAVAIHGVVAAGNAGQLAAVLAHLLLQRGDIAGAAGGQRVTSVHKGVDEDLRDALLLGSFEQRVQVLLMRVDAAVGNQPEEMQLRHARLLQGFDDGRVREEFAVGDQAVDAGDVHLHNAPGADVQVTHFAVAHLAIGQADEVIGGVQQGVGILPQQLVVRRLARQRDGVIFDLRSIAPAIQNGQNNRLF